MRQNKVAYNFLFLITFMLTSKLWAESKSYQYLIDEIKERYEAINLEDDSCFNDRLVYQRYFSLQFASDEDCSKRMLFNKRDFKVRFNIGHLDRDYLMVIGAFINSSSQITCDRLDYCEVNVKPTLFKKDSQNYKNLIDDLETQDPRKIDTLVNIAISFFSNFKKNPNSYSKESSFSFSRFRDNVRTCLVEIKRFGEEVDNIVHDDNDTNLNFNKVLGLPADRFLEFSQNFARENQVFVETRILAVSKSITLIDDSGKKIAENLSDNMEILKANERKIKFKISCESSPNMDPLLVEESEDYVIFDSYIRFIQKIKLYIYKANRFYNEARFSSLNECFRLVVEYAKTNRESVAVNISNVPYTYLVLDQNGDVLHSGLSANEASSKYHVREKFHCSQ